MDKVKYIVKKIMFVFCFMLAFQQIELCNNGSIHAEEYSEEEKAAAKAWLSSHGYSPTREGAAQAYQDYLNGKFDDDPQVQAAKQASEQEVDNTTEAKKKKKKSKKKSSATSSTEDATENVTTATTQSGVDDDVQKENTITEDVGTMYGTEKNANSKDAEQADDTNKERNKLSSEEIASDNVTEDSEERASDNVTDESDLQTIQSEMETDQPVDSFPASMYLLIAVGLCIVAAGIALIIFLKH